MVTDEDPRDAHGRSDRTQLALLATRHPAGARLARLFARGEVGVVGGLALGLRFPARALPPGHAHTRQLLRGELEVPVQEALRRSLPEGGVLWDVGANVGFFSLLGARLVGEAGRVVAWEPVTAVAELAREAALRSGLEARVEVRSEAVGAAVGSEELLVCEDASWSHLASRGNVAGTRVTEVSVTTLDAALSGGARPPDVVKLDVEGSEADVLRGGRELLASHGPVLVIELHDTAAEVCDLLAAAGYLAERLDGQGPARDAPPHAHLLARPR
ncbi:MAG: FkbM family methyltransferase [Solirubrobacterales bacterium]|nr:FkbM family methyltransferase [Solirubrobacterales bacterium]